MSRIEMLGFPGFTSAAWYVRDPTDEGDERDPAHVRWTVHYHVVTRADLERYFAEDAARMRDDGVQRFGGRFRASRRILAEREGVSPRRGS